MEDIFSTRPVLEKKELFGRKDELDTLFNYIDCNNSGAIIATRRFGKTSILRVLCQELKNHPHVFPVFIDCSVFAGDVLTRNDVYRYIVAEIIAELFRQKVFIYPEDIDGYHVEPFESASRVKRNLLEIEDCVDLFNGIVNEFNERMKKIFFMLFDEYEFLVSHSLAATATFMPIRNLYQNKMINYIIAGAKDFDDYETEVGSSQLNLTGFKMNLPPISKKDFNLMWDYEVNKIENKEIRHFLRNYKDFAYEKSGGVPFYGKLIGQKLHIEHTAPSYKFFERFFKEILNGYVKKYQKSLLRQYAIGEQNIEYDANLEEMGLISKNEENRYNISVGFLSDYIKSLNDKEYDFVPESYILGSSINKKIGYINQYMEVFCPTGMETNLLERMQKPVYDQERMMSFALAVYQTYLERSKGRNENSRKEIYGFKIPDKFSKQNNRRFIYALDALRQEYGHLEYQPLYDSNQMSAQEMFEFFSNSPKVPVAKDEYYTLQVQVLRMLDNELTEMLEYVRLNNCE